MPSFYQLASSLKKIKESKNVYGNKNILSEYIKLSLKKAAISKKYKNNVPGTYHLLDYDVAYLSFATMVNLFNEIFVGLEYYFDTNTQQPYIIDCGSNMGMSILFYKYLYPDAEIVGIEADALTYDVLKKNISQNKLQNTEVYHCAVMDYDGTVTFYNDPDNIGSLQMSTIQERESKSKTEIECVSLERFITKPVDFLKMDIEGAESRVINDLYSKGKLAYIKKLIIEYHQHIKTDEDNLSVMLHQLEDANFGYQISAKFEAPYKEKEYQDIMIYAYQK